MSRAMKILFYVFKVNSNIFRFAWGLYVIEGMFGRKKIPRAYLKPASEKKKQENIIKLVGAQARAKVS